MKWQRRARLLMLVVAIAAIVAVATTIRRRPAPPADPSPVARVDNASIAESGNGFTFRDSKGQEKVRIDYERQATYQDGSTKMFNVKVTTDRNDKRFEIRGEQAQIGTKESAIEIAGKVVITASDGMTVNADRVSYLEATGITTTPGPFTFARGRTTGSGVGFTYDKQQDILTIQNQGVVHVNADDTGAGAMDINAGGIEFRRNEQVLRFDRMMKATREREVVEADTAVAHLSADENRIEAMELRGNSRITGAKPSPGALQILTGRDIDLRYAPDGQTIEHAFVNADAVVQLAGERGQPGRQITANVIDVSIGPDGATIGGLSARDNVKLTLPAEANGVARVIEASTLESTGNPKKGLDAAHFTGNVRFDERGPKVARAARSEALDVTVGPGFSSIDDARFSRAVRFADDPLFATAALARYSIERGTLDLGGSEPGSLRPHVVNDRLVVDATAVTIKLEGPVVTADGQVKSLLQPKKAGAKDDDTHLPSMLKDDQPVNVTANRLEYQGSSEQASYTGGAQLWQGETLVKGSAIQLDTKKGDLVAEGPAMTVSLLEQEDKNGKKEKVRSTGTAQGFKYEDKDRRATYAGEAHLIGPQGDMTSPKIELYLKESGDELERVEAYEAVTLRGNGRKTTGVRLTYFGDDNRYVVVGTPVTIVDDCGGETTGRTLTFFRTTDRIVVDGRDVHGNEQVRTQSTGKSNCPGS